MRHHSGTSERQRRKRRRSRRFDHGEPISRIDLRPMVVFATVMVAFLSLFQQGPTHALVIELWDGRTAHPLIGESEADPTERDQPINRVTLTPYDQILWNGEAVTSGQLITLLSAASRLDPQPVIEFEPDANSSYDLSAKLLLVLKKSGATFRIAGLEKYCRFGNGDWRVSGRGTSMVLAHSISMDRRVVVVSGDPLFDLETCDPRFVVHRPR